jgi:hypothetical protein
VEGNYVYNDQPTALGRLLLADLPQRVEAVHRARQIYSSKRWQSADELIDLLLAADPPYPALAMQLAEQARR